MLLKTLGMYLIQWTLEFSTNFNSKIIECHAELFSKKQSIDDEKLNK